MSSDSEENKEVTDATPQETPDDAAANLRKRQGGRAASPVPGPAAKAASSAAKDASKEAGALEHKPSIYALSPDKIWQVGQHKFAFIFFGSIAFAFLALCCFMSPTFQMLRNSYTLVAVSLLAYRFKLYWHKGWLAFFIELCYVVSFFLIGSLWICPGYGCSVEWELGVYIVAQGAVAGSTFPLQMGLSLHHPEAFETFFLHNSPMWVCYAIRWRNLLPNLGHHSLGNLVWLGFSRVYLVWVVFYWPCLMAQPFMPDFLASAETLPDGFIYPGATPEERMKKKRGDYLNWVKMATAGTLAHGCLSCTGFLAAAMTFQYHKVQMIWIFAVLAGCVDSALTFYKRSSDSSIPDPGIVTGLKKMGYAWVLLIPTYAGCWYFNEPLEHL